jgi:hypothetical protein
MIPNNFTPVMNNNLFQIVLQYLIPKHFCLCCHENMIHILKTSKKILNYIVLSISMAAPKKLLHLIFLKKLAIKTLYGYPVEQMWFCASCFTIIIKETPDSKTNKLIRKSPKMYSALCELYNFSHRFVGDSNDPTVKEYLNSGYEANIQMPPTSMGAVYVFLHPTCDCYDIIDQGPNSIFNYELNLEKKEKWNSYSNHIICENSYVSDVSTIISEILTYSSYFTTALCCTGKGVKIIFGNNEEI